MGTAVAPAELISLVNRVLLARRVESRLATVFFGSVTPRGRLVYCNAAQIGPLLFLGRALGSVSTSVARCLARLLDAVYEQGKHRIDAGRHNRPLQRWH